MSLLSVHSLGKAYRSYSSEWQRIGRWFGFSTPICSETWVVRNVNFEIQPQEAVGIIGQNGAGKSSLLKMIAGTLNPTEGTVQVNGRISAILELGMGFNPELTGRENTIHSLGLMGYRSAEIKEIVPDIKSFTEIEEYFDEPVRTYSSGMQMRVAFAVATAFRPEILIVDEALAVGDAYFQHKSFKRIREYREMGTTLLIVSHDQAAIKGLCDRAILLESGLMIKDGQPEEIFDFYNAIIAQKEEKTVEMKKLEDGKVQTRSGTGEARVEEIQLYNIDGEAIQYVNVGETVELRGRIKVYQSVDSLVLGYGIKDRLGQVMYGTNTWHSEQVIRSPQAGDTFGFSISFPANLGIGSYSVQTALVDRDTHLTANYEWQDIALVFNVVNHDKMFFAGSLWIEPTLKIEKSIL